jgi:hypothetical protein
MGGKDGKCGRERDEAARRKSGGDADHVLLGNPHLKEAVWERVCEQIDAGRVPEVPVENNDPLVQLPELDECLSKRKP